MSSNINLLPWRQNNAALLHKKLQFCKIIMLMMLTGVEIYRFRLNVELNGMQDLVTEYTQANENIQQQIKTLRANYLELEKQAHVLRSVRNRQQVQFNWYAALIKNLPSNVVLLSFHLKKDEVNIVAMAEKHTEIANFIHALTKNKSLLACNIRSIKWLASKNYNLNYMFNLHLKISFTGENENKHV
ncbi:MAG: hypothetical protein A3F18_01220 [Legionellales bacterium RIFCSPHIGHO2_12_FULL_37_14]|nr:MAG: hypothetical protein A3F18_01220 [Legionellales bacterium RIFCSPHIGHO2_12_FULL_37_14]